MTFDAPSQIINDVVLKKLRADLERTYGDRLERIVLYGSRARGDARDDSDYDVAVFLRGLESRWDEIDTITELAYALLIDQGAVIHAMPYKAGAYKNAGLLMHELRREGKDI